MGFGDIQYAVRTFSVCWSRDPDSPTPFCISLPATWNRNSPTLNWHHNQFHNGQWFIDKKYQFRGSSTPHAGRTKNHGSQVSQTIDTNSAFRRRQLIRFSPDNQPATIAQVQLAAAQSQVSFSARLQEPFFYFGYGEYAGRPGHGAVANQMSDTGLRSCAVAQARVVGRNAVADLALSSIIPRSLFVQVRAVTTMMCVGRQGFI